MADVLLSDITLYIASVGVLWWA